MSGASVLQRLIHPREREAAEREAAAAAAEARAYVLEDRRKKYEVRPGKEDLEGGWKGVRHGEAGPLMSVIWKIRDVRVANIRAAHKVPDVAALVVDAALEDLERQILDAVDAVSERVVNGERVGR